jgi:hypothetical protein
MKEEINFLFPIKAIVDNPERVVDSLLSNESMFIRVWTNYEEDDGLDEVNIWIEDIKDEVGATIMIPLSFASAYCLAKLILNAMQVRNLSKNK